jgi:Ca2+-binding RTX toxin-like protein
MLGARGLQVRMRAKIASALIVVGSAVSMGGGAQAVPVNVIYGTDRTDVIYGTPGPDLIYAKSGSDAIRNVGDGDVVYASSGNDVVTLLPGVTATGLHIDLNVGNDRVTGRAQDSYVNGGSGNDVLTLDGCRNEIIGESGREDYTNLELCLGPDGSNVSMGDGDDRVRIWYASEVLLGNGKDILITKFPGSVHTGSGNDFVDFLTGSGDAQIGLGSGDDRVNLEDTSGSTIYGSSGSDRVYGLGHDNEINTASGVDRIELYDASANNALDGGPGAPDRALIDRESIGTTCTRIERITDLGSNRRSCS